MRKNYLVTGGSGFLGSHIADFLSNKKNNVTLFDKKKSIYKNKQQKMGKKSPPAAEEEVYKS